MSGPDGEAAGACYGFRVRSSVPLAYLRGPAGCAEGLDVGEPSDTGPRAGDRLVLDLPGAASGRLDARIYEGEDSYRFWMEGGGWFDVDPVRRTIRVPAGAADEVAREELMWGVPALLCFMLRGDLPLHAAAVQVGDEAIVLAGPSTAGKTTLAAAFHAAGHRLLSEDLVCYRLAPGAAVIPGPAMLRLRPDAAEAARPEGAQAVGHGGGRLHLALPDRERGDCRPVPIRAIVFLAAGSGAARLDPVPAAEALRRLWGLSFGLPTDDHRIRAFTGLADLVSSARTWELRRRMTWSALAETVSRIAMDA